MINQNENLVKIEINNILEVLQNKLPCNPNSKQNIKLADRLEQTMVDYFESLELAIPNDEIEKIYHKYEEK